VRPMKTSTLYSLGLVSGCLYCLIPMFGPASGSYLSKIKLFSTLQPSSINRILNHCAYVQQYALVIIRYLLRAPQPKKGMGDSRTQLFHQLSTTPISSR